MSKYSNHPSGEHNGRTGHDQRPQMPVGRSSASGQEPGAETREWQDLTSVIEDALREEREAADRVAGHQDEDSDYPALPVGAEVIPAPGSKDWRRMTPAGSPAYKDAQAHPQTPEDYSDTLDVMSELRPPLADHSD